MSVINVIFQNFESEKICLLLIKIFIDRKKPKLIIFKKLNSTYFFRFQLKKFLIHDDKLER